MQLLATGLLKLKVQSQVILCYLACATVAMVNPTALCKLYDAFLKIL